MWPCSLPPLRFAYACLKLYDEPLRRWLNRRFPRHGYHHAVACASCERLPQARHLNSLNQPSRRLVIENASWNVNSVRARLQHIKTWIEGRTPDVVLLQELKGTEFPSEFFKDLGYDSVAVTQKAYNGVAILSRQPIELVSSSLGGDTADTHARFLEARIGPFRIVNIYLPNGNPVGTEKFEYKLAWMDRLALQMELWLSTGVPHHRWR